MIGTLPDGSRGFDANCTVRPEVARRFVEAGFQFVVRYVRRTDHHDFDLTRDELAGLLSAGLGVMVVQHVAPPGWMPSQALGTQYGQTAAVEALKAGVPVGVTLWCDLEGVSSRALAVDVMRFCNAWFDAVLGTGFAPGLYVGDSCGLTAAQLYQNLRFNRFWAAYNLNRDNYPAIRGVCMKQGAYPIPTNRVSGCPFEYDVDGIRTDALGGTPVLLLPDACRDLTP